MEKLILVNKIAIKNRKSKNGIVTFKGVIAKAKIHEFDKNEFLVLPNAFANEEIIKILYPKDVFESSLESLSFLPVTNEHPYILFADAENKKFMIDEFQKGLTSEAMLNDDEVETYISVYDESLLTDILNDKKELSWGGYVKIKWLNEDEAKEKGYHGVLVDEIIGDHIAIVDKGRCDEDCKLFLNSKYQKTFKTSKNIKNSQKTSTENKTKIKDEKIISKGEKMKILVNGKEFEADKDLATAVNEALGAKDGEINALKKEIEKLKNAAKELEEIKKKARLQDVVNKAKEIDPDFNIDEDKATILDVINEVMGTDEKNEDIAYSAFNAYYKFYKNKAEQSNIVASKNAKEIEDAITQVDNVYKELFA